jgi:hypothetical protein
VTVFRDKVSIEIFKIYLRLNKGGALSGRAGVLIKGRMDTRARKYVFSLSLLCSLSLSLSPCTYKKVAM